VSFEQYWKQTSDDVDSDDMLDDFEERLRQAEVDGAEIAARAEQTEATLRAEIAQLTNEVSQASQHRCVWCRWKDMILAIVWCFFASWFWHANFCPCIDPPEWLQLSGVAFAMTPAIVAVIRLASVGFGIM
jgi:hypothetical protein